MEYQLRFRSVAPVKDLADEPIQAKSWSNIPVEASKSHPRSLRESSRAVVRGVRLGEYVQRESTEGAVPMLIDT